MQSSDYPALFVAADTASASAQRSYLNLILGQFLLLLLIAFCNAPEFDSRMMRVVALVAILLSLALMIYLASSKPEQAWYRSRALAESIKTATWRFMMRAAPFGPSDPDSETVRQFRQFLSDILAANREADHAIRFTGGGGEQITTRMREVRALPLEERRAFYRDARIANQMSWYTTKAQGNRRSFTLWAAASFLAYAVVILFSILRIVDGSVDLLPVEPFLVMASSIIGWMQIKKFNELASSYALTTHEIGLVESRFEDARDEAAFEAFVNEAEQAFSREHTQWVARQQHEQVHIGG